MRQINIKKSFFYKFISLIFFFFILSTTISGQTLTLLDNPDRGNFSGSQVIYKDLLYYRYQATDGVQHLGRYDGRDMKMFSLFDVSDKGFEKRSDNDILVVKDVLYHTYTNASGAGCLAVYNDTDYKFIANPDDGKGNSGGFIEYQGSLYFLYANKNDRTQLARFDGSNYTLITNPDKGYASRPVVLGDLMYFLYKDDNNIDHLAQFDGTNITLQDLPRSGFYANLFNGNNGFLYFEYSEDVSMVKKTVFKTNGTEISLIENADAGNGYQGKYLLFYSKLFINYADADGKNRLAVEDGNRFTLFPNPDAGLGVMNSFIDYKGDLYFKYEKEDKNANLARFDGGGIKIIENPAEGIAETGTHFVFNSELYMGYINREGRTQLGKFDGSTIKLLSNPDGGNLIDIQPFTYRYVPYFSYNRENTQVVLANLNAVLPIEFTDFSGYTEGGKNQLTWHIASALNTVGFDIERKKEDNTWLKLGFVPFDVKNETYQFRDETPNSGINYYRLRTLENDGKTQYSKIIALENTNILRGVKIYPNPVSDNLHIDNATGKNITLFNALGQVVQTTQQLDAFGQLNVSALPIGTYFVRIAAGSTVVLEKIFKR